MKCIKLSTENGWKPHVVCDLLGLRKHHLDNWMLRIDSERKLNVYSTFEIIMICTIVNYQRKTRTDIDELLKVNWLKFKNELVDKITTNDLSKIIQIDWNAYEIEFTDYDEFSDQEKEGMSSSFELRDIVEEITRCLLWKNHN